MNLQIKQSLEALSGNKIVKDEKLLNKVIWSLKARQEKYGKLFLSRKEHKKFGTSERQLQKIIKAFRAIGLLEYIGRERKEGNKYSSCVYKATTILTNIFEMLVGGIKDLHNKICTWVKENSTLEVLQSFGVKLVKKGYRKKLWLNPDCSMGRKGQIKNRKTEKGYNVFTYLMEFTGLSCFELSKKLKL